jgi:hypothetical protein
MKIEKTLFIQSRTMTGFHNDDQDIIINSNERESGSLFTFVTLGTTKVSVEVDDSNLHARIVNAQIDVLQRARIKILADSQVKANNLNEQIKTLQALECK